MQQGPPQGPQIASHSSALPPPLTSANASLAGVGARAARRAVGDDVCISECVGDVALSVDCIALQTRKGGKRAGPWVVGITYIRGHQVTNTEQRLVPCTQARACARHAPPARAKSAKDGCGKQQAAGSWPQMHTVEALELVRHVVSVQSEPGQVIAAQDPR